VKKIIVVFLVVFVSLYAESNVSKNVLKQIEKEKKYAQEQKFYQGKDYDLKGAEVDKSTVDKVPTIEPDYDFDITDVYRDDI
jgi:hypothetical protein